MLYVNGSYAMPTIAPTTDSNTRDERSVLRLNPATFLTLGAQGFLYTYKPQSGSIDPNGFSVHVQPENLLRCIFSTYHIQLPIEME